MKKRDCCWFYALLAGVAVMFLLAILRGFDLVGWSLFSWLAVLAIIVAGLVFLKCREIDEEVQNN